MNKNLKKVTMKDRYGNSVSFEMHNLMQGMTAAQVPPMQDIPTYDHPGDPKGTDTVPAWLTPGEFVMNAEATRMYEPQIKAMNDHGRAVQRQQGGTIPEYAAEGKMITGDDFQRYADAIRYAENKLSHYDDEGNVARSPDNAIGMMQVVPTTAARPGISTDVFKIADSMGIPYDQEAYAQELAARQVKGADVPPMAMAEADRLLQNPAINIRMGDEYLYKIGERNNGDLELAAAGYNAGQGGANKYSAAREAGDFSMLPNRMQKETVPYVDKVMQQYAPGIASDMAAGFRTPTGGDEYSDIGADPFEVPPLYQQSAEDAMAALGESRMPLEGNETTPLRILQERAGLPDVPEITATPPVEVMTTDVTDYGNEDESFEPTFGDEVKDISMTRLEPKSPRGEIKYAQDAIPEMDYPKRPNALWQNPDGDKDVVLPPMPEEGMAPVSNAEWKAAYDASKGVPTETRKKVEKSFFEQIPDMIKKGFDDTVDAYTKPAVEAGLMYLASRALGYDHDGSFKWASKRMHAQVAQNQKIKQELVKSDKFTYASIDDYMKSGNAADLKSKSPFDLSKDFKDFDMDGKRVRGYYDKKYGWVARTPQGVVPIDQNLPEWGEREEKSKAYTAWKNDTADAMEKIFDQHYQTEKRNEVGNWKVTGDTAATQIRNHFKDQGYNVNDPEVRAAMDEVSQQAARVAAIYAKNNKDLEITSLKPFIHQVQADAALGSYAQYGLFTINPDEEDFRERKYVNPKKISQMQEKLAKIAGNNYEGSRILREAAYAFNAMSAEGKKRYGLPSDDETLFYRFLEKITEDGKVTPEELEDIKGG